VWPRELGRLQRLPSLALRGSPEWSRYQSSQEPSDGDTGQKRLNLASRTLRGNDFGDHYRAEARRRQS
jgi:hypothetical protein